MKTIIKSSKRTCWFKEWATFLTCLLFLTFIACQKGDLSQDPILKLDNMPPSASQKDTETTGKVKDVEGNSYKTVLIGTQWWMAENLKTTRYRDGSPIPNITEKADWDAYNPFDPSSNGAYCWYDNKKGPYRNVYGALYDFLSVHQGELCPEGWHIPDDAELITMLKLLDPDVEVPVAGLLSYIAGGGLKNTGTSGWNWLSPNTGATNETGFTALPGGFRTEDGSFIRIGEIGVWWLNEAWSCFSLSYGGTDVHWSEGGNYTARSVRCVKDN